MAKNVDVVAVIILLVAAALMGGVRGLVTKGLSGSSRLIRLQKNGPSIYLRPVVPTPPHFPQLQHN